MFDFRLKVFYTVAQRLNFTKAASELYITQPAVTKHIHEIENHFKVKLFDRKGSKIKLTEAGEILFQHTKQIFASYRNIEFDLNNLNHKHNGRLRIGASTTIAQYILPVILADFHKKFKDLKITLTTNNTEQIEEALQKEEIDFGVIEGKTKNSSLKYTEFIKDEIVLATNSDNPLAKKGMLKLNELVTLPLLLREPGSGTLEVIAHALKPLGIKLSQLRCEMQLASTESIKSYLLHSNSFSFVSVYAILKELKNKELTIVDVKDLSIERHFYFIQQQGEVEALPKLFMQFANHYNFR
jgi:LysR family transcriptional regulator, transcriptional activator of the cysJI operon